MIAIVKVGGHQAIVQAGEQIEVDKISLEVGKTLELETLLISETDGSKCEIGDPVLSKKIKAKILEHGKGKKIRIYKMNPRKRYRRTQGHRQDYTIIEIEKFGVAPKAATKAETKKVAPKKPAAKKPVAKKVAKKS